MKKLILGWMATAIALNVAAQIGTLNWHQVHSLPTEHVYMVKSFSGKLYAATGSKVYSSLDGNLWDSSSVLPSASSSVNDICRFNGRLYAATHGAGILESTDDGQQWSPSQSHNVGFFPMEFTAKNNALYVATNNQGVYKLLSGTNQWTPHNNGLLNGTTFSFETLTSTRTGLSGGVGANGVLVHLADSASIWEEQYLTGGIAPGLTTYDILETDTSLWAFTSSKAFVSYDSGFSWTAAGVGMRNALHAHSRAVLDRDSIFATINFGGNNSTLYKRGVSEPSAKAWTAIDTFYTTNCHALVAFKNRLFLATSQGLYYLDLAPTTGAPELPVPGDEISVFPNPATGQATLKTNNLTQGGKYMVTDLAGRKVGEGLVNQGATFFDVTNLKTGMYLITVFGKFGRSSLKLAVHR